MSVPILVLGGAHIDRRGRIAGPLTMGASNPGSFISEPGGGGFNAACALARLGHPVRLVSPRGGDAAGEDVGAAARAAGIDDRPFVYLDRATPSYTAILDKNGDLVVALADMDLYRLFSPRRLTTLSMRAAVEGVDALLCDANLPAETLALIGDIARIRGVKLGAIAISPAKVVRFAPSLDRLDWLFMNVAEARALTGADTEQPRRWPELLRERGLKGGIVTNGAGPLIAFEGDTAYAVQPPLIDGVTDVTGAGDATAAAFFSARLKDIPLAQASRMAVAAALATLKTDRATATELSGETLQSELSLVPPAEMLL
ncbi:carbohydrate kinase family protein [Rhizobium halophytocola]|uniref:Sugar/nucleoside kinase (Ribokinase family) n=1 Tax=Rhizobium halophytocola TaxID=735519 RepID=A0ABS4DZ95_9HYPH|nr:carbohydrate kinase family protein [Rhizobium halophytocola]MBP1851003.1 sugar/nucleoside kinase (ribokinase family) [Rhizobium halophytocola]